MSPRYVIFFLSIVCTISLRSITLPDSTKLKLRVEQWCENRNLDAPFLIPYFYTDILQNYAQKEMSALEIRLVAQSAWAHFCYNAFYSRNRSYVIQMKDNDDLEALIYLLTDNDKEYQAACTVTRDQHTTALKSLYNRAIKKTP